MTSIAVILAFIVGGVIGWRLDWINRQLEALKKRVAEYQEPAAPAVSMGVYDKVDTANHTNTPGDFGIVEVKTPELLDWEERERVKKMQEPGQ